MSNLEKQIAVWRDYLRQKGNIGDDALEEMEGHLLDEIDSLRSKGLSEEEAFIIGVKRIGNADAVSKEFAKLNGERLWRQLLIEPDGIESVREYRLELVLLTLCALLAGTLAKIPAFLGFPITGNEVLYVKNISFFILPALGIFLGARQKTNWRYLLPPIVVGGISCIIVNLFPVQSPGHSEVLTAIHLPIALWLIMVFVYRGAGWKTPDGRMDFLRLSGETFIYSVLIAAGGMVLVLIAQAIFESIGIDLTAISRDYIIVYGAAATPIVAVFLVERKKSIIENLAPVLARIFIPLFLVLLISFIVVMLVLGKSPYLERDFLIGFDLLLVLVLGMVIYVISARDEQTAKGLMDYLCLGLICAALIVDGVALSAILVRITSFGLSPNKLAALGENILLLANLTGLALLYISFFRNKKPFRRIERFQTDFLPIYFAWALFVALFFPPLFAYR